MDRERLRKIRNWQSQDWYAAVFIRPMAILVMLVVADWRWLTPNLLTTLANLAKIAAVPLILTDSPDYLMAAAILLQLGLLFDNLDGTMARYRGTSSGFGSFYDKVSDAVTWFGILMAVGWIAYRRSDDALMLVLAGSSAYALLTLGYMKWVVEHAREKTRWRQAQREPALLTAPPPPARGAVPPQRTPAEWVRWYLRSWAQIYKFEEVDLFFWVGLCLVIGHLDVLLWVLAGTQVFGMLYMFVKRGLDMHSFDRIS